MPVLFATTYGFVSERAYLPGLSSVAPTVAVLGGLVFLFWVYRAAINLRVLGREGMLFTPGWCVAWFVFPLANLFMPYLVMRELWRASESQVGPGSVLWKKTRVAPLLLVWWISSLLSIGLTPVVDLRSIRDVVSMVAGLACAAVMGRIADRQDLAAVGR
jgi:hypothetical protein